MSETEVMKTSIPVHINVGDKSVCGLIAYLSASDIEVSYISVGGLIKAKQHIPYFSRPYNDYTTGYGLKRAKQLLLELYKSS